jgi:predicted amidohydrolase YtcJ
MTSTTGSLLLTQARLVPVGRPAPAEPVDVRVRAGVVTEVAPALEPEDDERVLPADGRWLIPGLWDAHVHMQQWSRSLTQLDLAGTTSPEHVTTAVAAHLAGLPGGSPGSVVVGYGYRSGSWLRLPTVAELDAVSGDHAVVLISGDAHNGWLSSRALALLGVPTRTGPMEEAAWFAVLPRVSALPTGVDPVAAARAAAQRAAAAGVVGIVDVEWEDGPLVWPARVAGGVDLLRVRTATYPDGLDDVGAAGLRTGDVLDPTGLVSMGPLKVIFDGSVNTRTAFCCDPYPASGDDGWRGVLNVTPDELTALCARAHRSGLEVALHAIGDAAVSAALDAVERSGARGSLEHVQLLSPADAVRFAALGVRASVQPAHLLDDRDLSAVLWPDAQERCFALRSLLDAGATLTLGSDAPVAPLDPWLAMAAAVHRSADQRPPWTPEEAITPAEALAASTDGQGTVAPGSTADLALLDQDPLASATDTAAAAARFRGVSVAATVVGGRLTHERE